MYLVSISIHILVTWPDLTPVQGLNSSNVIKFVVKFVLVVTENIDRYCDCYSSGGV
jgi:hypothetical protein